MAFNQQEQNIIDWGVQNGKTKEQVSQAITNLRMGIVPKTPTAQAPVEEKSPTLGGQIVRDVAKPLAKVGTSLVNIGQMATGQETTHPFSGDYLGDVGRVGEGFDASKGFTKENIAALKDSIKTGVDIGLLISGGGEGANIARMGFKEGVGTLAKEGAKLGSTTGAIGGASTGLEEGATLGSTAKNTIVGGLAGAATGGAFGAATGVGSKAIGAISESAQKVGQKLTPELESKVPKILSIFTGEGNDVVKSAMANPEIADLGIKGGDEALRKAVQTGADSSIKARQAFTQAYNDSFKQIADRNPGKLVSRQKILYQFVDDMNKAGIKVKNGDLDFTTSLINANPGEATKIKNAYEALQNWDDWSLEGTNLYKQLIGKLTKFANEAGGSSKSPFLGKFYNFLNDEIKTNLSKEDALAYSEMNKKFSGSIDLYDEMVDAFNSGDPFTKIAQVFGKNKDTLRQVVDFYEKTTGNKITPIVAGRQLAEERPASFGFLNPRQWIDFFVSPQKQAQIVTGVGKASQSFKNKASSVIETTGTKIDRPQSANKIKRTMTDIIPQSKKKTTSKLGKALGITGVVGAGALASKKADASYVGDAVNAVPERYVAQFVKAADKFGVPYDVLSSVIQHESKWNPKAFNPKNGDTGLGQHTKIFIQTYRKKFEQVYGHGYDPKRPYDNIHMTALGLADLHKQFGNWDEAIIAYNNGPTATKKMQQKGIKSEYLKKVKDAI